MKMKYDNIIFSAMLLMYFVTAITVTGCSERFLEAKPDKSRVVPETLNDYWVLLENTQVTNVTGITVTEMASDNLYVSDDNFQALGGMRERSAYTWQEQVLDEYDNNDWTRPYASAFQANLVIDGLESINRDDDPTFYDQVLGTAYFMRANRFYQLAQAFAPAYDEGSSNMDLGIVLRTTSDLNVPSTRANVEETYQQILLDVNEALRLLPDQTDYKSQPTRAAALALLARIKLSQRLYEEAGTFAREAWLMGGTLLDYNLLDTSSLSPISQFNEEVIFHTIGASSSIFNNYGSVDTALYKSYSEHDLRKLVFFDKRAEGHLYFKGSYSNQSPFFDGATYAEMLLIWAESLAREDNTEEAMRVLNILLEKRWRQDEFQPFEVGSTTEALDLILEHRRKELLFRGLRWTDIRRLNFEDHYRMTLRRLLNGEELILPPFDIRYVFRIPEQVIAISGIEQNK